MRILIAAAAMAFPLAPAAAQLAPGAPLPAKCKPMPGMAAQRGIPHAKPRKLGEMPPAAQIKALWRVVDGCPEPIVVRASVGGVQR